MKGFPLPLLLFLGLVSGIGGCGRSDDATAAGSVPPPGGIGGPGRGGSGGGAGGSPDNTPPQVVETDPPDGGRGAPLQNSIVATFSEPIDASTVGPNSFMVRDALGRSVTGTVSATDRTVQFLPAAGTLAAATAHQATLTTAISDLAGNHLPSEFSWTFTTVIDTWLPTAVTPDTPTARFDHTAVWTGTEMIVWGGIDAFDVAGTGGHYTPATNSWRATPLSGAPLARSGHSAVWTGNEMIVWGGLLTGLGGVTDTGARYTPSSASGTWLATPRLNAPLPRSRHTAVWTGREMIVWGGERGGGLGLTNTGGRFDPSGNGIWRATASGTTSRAPTPRVGHTAVWTGREMIVWGGIDNAGTISNTGARYDPDSDAWTPMADAPFARSEHSAVWTGSEMIIWGGADLLSDARTGARYDPATDTWILVTTNGAPTARRNHTAVWTGTEMMVWGGDAANVAGGAYSPARDSWRSISVDNAPLARTDHSAVWTGTEMIVWGGNSGTLFNTGGRYSP